jgi:hypothetical protein
MAGAWVSEENQGGLLELKQENHRSAQGEPVAQKTVVIPQW